MAEESPGVDEQNEPQIELASPEQIDKLHHDSLQHHKKTTLCILLGLFFVSGIFQYFIVENSDIYKNYQIVSLVIFAIVIMRWYILDAQQHHYRFSKPMFLMLVAANTFAAPFYFFATRGKKSWRSLWRLILFLLLSGVAVALGEGLGYCIALLLHVSPSVP